jgi:bacteriocin-type transport-associated protein
MSTMLLKELSYADVDWLTQIGTVTPLPPGTVLSQPHQPMGDVLIVLSGQLSVRLPAQPTAAEAAEPGSTDQPELLRLSGGDLVGALTGLNIYLARATMVAITEATVLSVPAQRLAQKLQDDEDFAAHFYRAMAQMLRHQLNQWAAKIGYSVALLSQLQLKEASTVFAELMDNDLDWLMAVGQVEVIKPDTPLLSCGYPVDALYILLDGAVGLRASERPVNLIMAAFIADPDRTEQEFARLSRGDLVGETIFLEPGPAGATAVALRDSKVLSIPRWRLMARLLYDRGFAARLYRLLTILLANKQQLMLQNLGFLPQNTALDSQLMERVALAEARFEWLVQRLQSQRPTGDLPW